MAAVLAVWLGLDSSGTRGSSRTLPPVEHFVSRPDLQPPHVTIVRRPGKLAPGYIFLAPKKNVVQAGPLIVDNNGHVVWFDPLPTKAVSDFKVQTYQGKPVLTWWQGAIAKGGYADSGGYRIMDSSYRLIRIVHAGHGLTGDIHEFLLTPRGTALMTIFHKARTDLSPIGGPRRGYVLEGVVQEISLTTGKVLFEWHSLGAVAPAESYVPLDKSGSSRAPYDYFHVNAISTDTDGNLLVSARHTSTIYKIRRSDGAVMWRLGGKKSDFKIGPGATFRYQHDVRGHADGTITLFDNNARASLKGDESKALRLRVDASTHRATLVHAYRHTPPLLAPSQGNVQLLPNGHVFVGWGQKPYFTEFSASGASLLDGQFDPSGTAADSYRSFRLPWAGHPTTKPDAVAVTSSSGTSTVYASWNGATDLARWQVLGGPDASHLSPLAAAAKTGFETAVPLPTAQAVEFVRALSSSGSVLATSPVVQRRG